MSVSPIAPKASALVDLRPSNLIGGVATTAALVVTAGGVWLSSQSSAFLWLMGQVVVAAMLVEWFVLLHECGHGTFFRARWANTMVGHLAGVFAIIPYPIWKRIHGRHHKWTGWQDVDPTTAALARRSRSPGERAIVNVCWKYWIPLFSVLYRLSNFWNLPRLMRLFPDQGVQRRMFGSAVVVGAIYVGIAIAGGVAGLARLGGLAVLLAFVLEDVLLISQHTHIPMRHSGGHPASPYPALDQERFTRSLRMPRWASVLTLHFDAHELHHMYPFVPGYRLREIDYTPVNEVRWWHWLARARALPGDILLFQNRNESGFDV